MAMAHVIDANGFYVSSVMMDANNNPNSRTDLTLVQPPEFSFGYARRFVGGIWIQVEDNRMKVFNLPDGTSWSPKEIGEAIPEGAVRADVAGQH